MTDESWYVVRNTPNVTGFVGSHGGGSKPSPLYDEEIERILKSQGQPAKEPKADYEVGETVTIIDGAFSGMSGKITEINPEKINFMFQLICSAEKQTLNLTITK